MSSHVSELCEELRINAYFSIWAALRARTPDRPPGVDVIKAMASGGFVTPGWAIHESRYAEAELRTIADRAHARGVPVVAHAHGGASIVDALRAGFDGTEHCTFVTADFVDCDWATVDALAGSGIIVSVGDPLADITSLLRPTKVIRAGEPTSG